MATRKPFATIEEAEQYTQTVSPRLEDLRNTVKHGVLPNLDKLSTQWQQLMLDKAPGGALAEYATQIDTFIPAAAATAINTVFADLSATVQKLYQLNARYPNLLRLDPPEEG